MISTRKLGAIGAVLGFAASGIAFAQTVPDQPDRHPMGPDHQRMMESGQHPMGPEQMQQMMRQHYGIVPIGDHAGMDADSTIPTLPGQDAFAAIQEIVQILDADPNTDWSKVPCASILST